MKPFISFTFPSGQVYQVPTQVIADNRTEYYFGREPELAREAHAADTAALFADGFEVTDWAANNMNWSDIAPHARLVGFEAEKLESQWAQASGEMNDDMRLPPQMHGDTILMQPLEMVLSVMAADRQGVNAILVDGSGDHKVAFITVRGPAPVVDSYLMMVEHFTQHLQKQEIEAQAAENGTLAPSTDTTN